MNLDWSTIWSFCLLTLCFLDHACCNHSRLRPTAWKNRRVSQQPRRDDGKSETKSEAKHVEKVEDFQDSGSGFAGASGT